MEQLTDVELHQLEELLSTQALAVKKAAAYAEVLREEPLRQLARDAARLHRRHLDDLLHDLHALSGGLEKPGVSPA
jgi:GAF domain-containing protein